MLIASDYKRSEPSKSRCETSLHRPIARRGKARATSSGAVPDVQTVRRGGRMCGSWLLIRAEYVPDDSEPYVSTAGRAA
eukprot:373693-Prymnesium_polylepis.1